MMRAYVDLKQFGRAARAVLPHVLKAKPGDEPDLAVMRLTFTQELVWAQASNGVSSAAASADVVEHQGLTGDPVDDSLELGPDMIVVILDALRPSADDLDQSIISFTTRDERDGRWVEVQDVSGMIPGQCVTVRLAPRPDYFPNIPGMAATRVSAKPIQALGDPESGPAGKIRLEGIVDRLKPFGAAEKQYKESVVFQAVQGHYQLLATCTERFIGAVKPHVPYDGKAEWHEAITEAQETLSDQLEPIGRSLALAAAAAAAQRNAKPEDQAS
jgi:hypothetical protein